MYLSCLFTLDVSGSQNKPYFTFGEICFPLKDPFTINKVNSGDTSFPPLLSSRCPSASLCAMWLSDSCSCASFPLSVLDLFSVSLHVYFPYFLHTQFFLTLLYLSSFLTFSLSVFFYLFFTFSLLFLFIAFPVLLLCWICFIKYKNIMPKNKLIVKKCINSLELQCLT